jgi:hypothetical protein
MWGQPGRAASMALSTYSDAYLGTHLDGSPAAWYVLGSSRMKKEAVGGSARHPSTAGEGALACVYGQAWHAACCTRRVRMQHTVQPVTRHPARGTRQAGALPSNQHCLRSQAIQVTPAIQAGR